LVCQEKTQNCEVCLLQGASQLQNVGYAGEDWKGLYVLLFVFVCGCGFTVADVVVCWFCGCGSGGGGGASAGGWFSGVGVGAGLEGYWSIHDDVWGWR